MIRFKLDAESTEFIDYIKQIYKYNSDGNVIRIALAMSLFNGKKFSLEEDNFQRNGREYTQTNNTFGRIVNGVDNYIIYKAILCQHYSKDLYDAEAIIAFKSHLYDGIGIWRKNIEICDIAKGEHISFILNFVKKGLNLRSDIPNISSKTITTSKEYRSLLSFEIGTSENGEPIQININDLREFDNRNIAIAGMAGSGKTQLVKDILYQISKNSNYELKFIFFDYKGEGNIGQLKPFLEASKAEFIDIVNNGGIDFNPLSSIHLDEKQKPFSIRAFVDTVATFVPKMGISQQNILITLINDLINEKNNEYPTINELFEKLINYYEENEIRQDTLYAIIRDLSTNIFNCRPNLPNVLDKSLYLNLPPSLSDTLRQLIVFLLLRYFNAHFSSVNDCEPNEYIFPLRYVIVIDEAHIYLKNKNARKALEDLLRLMRSKGVIVIMLSQGVEDYKTKDFDFASQVKLPICLNIQNKDYKNICNFLGTPNSKYKLESEIKKLDSGKGLINIGEPKIITLRQWWKTKKNHNI